MKYVRTATMSLVLGTFGLVAGLSAGASSVDSDSNEVRAEGAGVSFSASLPAGFELQGVGPEWYVVEEGTTRPLVLVKFQMGKSVEGVIADGFGRVDGREPVEFSDGVTGALVEGSYEAPPEEEYVQPWYLHPAPGSDGIFMIAEFRARPWTPFHAFARSFRQGP